MEGQRHGQPVEETSPGIVLGVPPPSCARVVNPQGRGARASWSGQLFVGPGTPGTSCRFPAAGVSASSGGPSAGAPLWGRSRSGTFQPPVEPARTFHTEHTTRGAVQGRQAVGGSGPGAVRARSRSRTGRRPPPASVWSGPGWGSTSPHVASDPRPDLGEGLADILSGVVWRGGMGGRASGPRAARVRRTSSVVAQNRHVPRWLSTPAPPSAVGRECRHRVHCSTGHPLCLSHHSKAWPSGPRVAESSRSRRPVTSSWMNWGWGPYVANMGPSPAGAEAGPDWAPRRRSAAAKGPFPRRFSGGSS